MQYKQIHFYVNLERHACVATITQLGYKFGSTRLN